MWPIVPMLTCGLLRSNFSFAMPKPNACQDCEQEEYGSNHETLETRMELVTFRYGRSTNSLRSNSSNNRRRSVIPARLLRNVSRLAASLLDANSSRATTSQG